MRKPHPHDTAVRILSPWAGIYHRKLIIEFYEKDPSLGLHVFDQNKFTSGIVVTSPHHLNRAKFIFQNILKNKKLEFIASESPANFLEKILFNLREMSLLHKLKNGGIDLSKI